MSTVCFRVGGRAFSIERHAAAIYTRSKLPGITLPDSAPAFDVYYNAKALWPAASLERLKAVMAPANAGA